MRLSRVGLAMWLALIGCGDGDEHLPETEAPLPLEAQIWIGTAYGDSMQEFTDIRAVDMTDAGEVLIADAGLGEVRRFNTSGAFLGAIGRRGSGPGEFRRLSSIAIRGDTLLAFDPGAQRVSLFRISTGEVIAAFTVADAVGDPILSNGSEPRFLSDSTVALGLGWRTQQAENRRRELLRVYTVDGQVIGTLVVEGPHEELYYFDSEMGRNFSIYLPFTPRIVWAVTPEGGAAVGWSGQYLIHEIDIRGDTVRTIARDAAPMPVDTASRNSAVRAVTRFLEGFRAVRKGYIPAFPAEQPQFDALSYSRDGSELWVRRTSHAPDPIYDVVVDGEYRCSVKLLAGGYSAANYGVPVRLTRTAAFQVAFDSLGTQYVLGYYLRGSARVARCLERN